VENITVIYLSQIGSEFLPANFSLSYFVCQFIDSAHLFSPIRVYHRFTYKYISTAHYSAVLFWTQNRLDQIKVIARAHPCHHFYTSTVALLSGPSMFGIQAMPTAAAVAAAAATAKIQALDAVASNLGLVSK
jgi:hypothetical protein